MVLLISVLRSLFSLYSLALVGRVFLEMILGPYHSAVVFLRRITEPVLAPIRRILPPMGGFAFRPSRAVPLPGISRR